MYSRGHCTVLICNIWRLTTSLCIHVSEVLATLCTETWRRDRLAGGWPSSALDRYCSVNSPVHYHLTDLGVDCLLRLAPHTPALVVTNADNAYLPGFSAAARACLRGEGAGQCGQAGGVDVALVHMLHRAQPMQVRPDLGRMDLGCAAIRTSALFSQAQSQFQTDRPLKRLTFADSLPSPTAPENWHDAGSAFVNCYYSVRGLFVTLTGLLMCFLLRFLVHRFHYQAQKWQEGCCRR